MIKKDDLIRQYLNRTKAQEQEEVQHQAGYLSQFQKSMWLLETMSNGKATYNIPIILELRGKLNKGALEQSIQKIIERHDVLRSYYPIQKDIATYKISEKYNFKLPYVDLSNIYYSDINDIIDPEISRPFGLNELPLFRTKLLLLAKDKYLLIITFHHIIFDGWSLKIFFNELAQYYNNEVHKSPITLKPINKSYFLIAAEAEIRHRKRLGKQLEYWEKVLRELPPLELPTDYLRPVEQSFNGDKEIIWIDQCLTEKLKKFAKDNQLSLFMLLKSAFLILLYKYTGQTKLSLGVPVANRETEEELNIIGPFVNTIVTSSTIIPDQLVVDFLNYERQRTLEDFENQQVSFERVVTELSPKRSLSHNPVIQAFFALQNASNGIYTFKDIETIEIESKSNLTRFDLEMTIFERGEQLKLRLSYSTDLFTKSKIQTILANYHYLLESILSSVNKKIIELNYLNAEERKIRIPIFTPVADNGKIWRDFILESCKRFPDKIAAECVDQDISYKRLDISSKVISNYLIKKGIKPDSIVALYLPRTSNMVIGLAGVICSGAAFLPLNPLDPDERNKFILKDADIDCIISTRQMTKPYLEEFSHILFFIEDILDSQEIDSKVTLLKVKPENLAYIIYTSGTTGNPKGVRITNYNITSLFSATTKKFHFTQTDVIPCLANYNFDIFYFELFSSICHGGTAILLSEEQLINTDLLISKIKKSTRIHAVPGLMRQILNAIKTIYKTYDYENLKTIFIGGDLVPRDVLESLSTFFINSEIFVLYGPTEATILCTSYRYSGNQNRLDHIIGEPFNGMFFIICNNDGQILPEGFIGEIYIGGSGVANGYIKDELKNKEKFVTIQGSRFFKSGDLGKINSNKELVFLGRIDNQIKIRGFRVEPGEIDFVISQQPFIKNSKTKAFVHRGEKYIVSYLEMDENFNYLHFEQENVKIWKKLFNQTHTSNNKQKHGKFDFTGWNSRFTKQPFSNGDMIKWLNRTIKRIKICADKEKLANRELKILEIGCGTGLILHCMVPYCSLYVGTDYSTPIITNLKKSIKNELKNIVKLINAEADDWSNISNEKFDLVIFNSVIQYFPSEQYLINSINNALNVLQPNGVIFIGDIRNLDLLEDFNQIILGSQVEQLNNNHAEGSSLVFPQENELLISPKYFRIQEQLSSGRLNIIINHRNKKDYNLEMTYRYDINISIKHSNAKFLQLDNPDLISKPLNNQLFKFAKNQLKSILSTLLPEYMVPYMFIPVHNIPLTENGKIDINALPKPNLEFRSKIVVLPRTELENIMVKAWEEVLSINGISIMDNFFEIGGNSLLAIQVTLQLKKYNIHIKPQVLFKYQDIEHICQFLENEVKSFANNFSLAANRPSNHEQKGYVFWGNENYIKDIILLGATGFLGVHILHNLIKTTNSTIHIIIRSSSINEAKEKLWSLINWYFSDLNTEILNKRLKVYCGDITKEKLGLDKKALRHVLNNSSHLINAAADVRHVGPVEKFFLVNHIGVKNIINTICEYNIEFAHVSTIGVKGVINYLTKKSFYTENDFDIKQSFIDPYSESKYLADQEVNKFLQSGGRGSIFRVGTISPHSETGKFQKNAEEHFLSRFLHGVTNLGVAPYIPTKTLHLTPVNEIAEIIVALQFDKRIKNNVFHIQTPYKMSYDQLIRHLQFLGFSIRIITVKDFYKELILYPREEHKIFLGEVLPIIDNVGTPQIDLETNITNEYIKDLGLEYGKPSSLWIKKFLSQLVDTGYFSTPAVWGEINQVPDIITSDDYNVV